MDKLVNSILGRPAATTGIHSDQDSTMLDDLLASGDPRIDCLAAAYGMANIINDITTKLYDRKEISIPVVEQFLRAIDDWKQLLPQSVQSGAVGSIHVSCIYYFAVTLVTRPILIATLINHRSGRTVHPHLAAACLDAAMYLAQTCFDALNAGLLQGNMCIMK